MKLSNDSARASAADGPGPVSPNNCESEPIRIPGSIQPHGALVAFESSTGSVLHSSNNLQTFFSTELQASGQYTLKDLTGDFAFNAIAQSLAVQTEAAVRHQVVDLPARPEHGQPDDLEALVHSYRGVCFAEFFGATARNLQKDWLQEFDDTMDTLRIAQNLEDLLQRTAQRVKRLSGFDRVMVYRFDEEWNGQVVAEALEPQLEPFLGLHYPASDIPPQARELYSGNLVRYIADVNYQAVPVAAPGKGHAQQALDLSYAALRSISPMHIQYLQNMGVHSTLVISILVNGKLWGLIACHHHRPTKMPVRFQRAYHSLAVTLGYMVSSIEERVRSAQQAAHAEVQRHVMDAFNQVHERVEDIIETCAAPLLQMAQATAGIFWIDTEVYPLGGWPAGPLGVALLEHARQQLHSHKADAFYSDHLQLEPALSDDEQRQASGMAALRLNASNDAGLLLIRPEYRQQVYWGGNPEKPVTRGVDGQGQVYLTPRASFERWEVQVTGRSRPWSDLDQAGISSLGSLREVLKVREALERVILSDRRLSLAVEAAHIGVWDYFVQENRLVWDPGMYALYGIEKENFSGAYDAWQSGLHPEDKARGDLEISQALGGEKAFDTEFRVVWPTGEVRNIKAAARVLRDSSGKPLRMIGVNYDMTERKRIEEHLRAATQAAQESSVAKSQFLANMSHEIRTPMNAILGLLDLLQSTELTDRQRDYAGKTEDSARSLLGLLNDILDFSKIESDKMKLESEPFRIGKLLRNLSTILSANVGKKDIEVLFDVDSALPAVVCGDAMRLQQVLINLGGNAVKFTSQGQIVLALRKQSQTDKTVTIRFTVQDTGIGIAAENQAHIFSGFSQAEGSTTRKFGGTGLGLAISKRFVELMGGEISLTSELGVGSTFSFELEMPMVETIPEELAEPLRPTVAPQRVLVVDDNPIAGVLALRMLRSWGWMADLAVSGEQALDMISALCAPGEVGFPYPVIYMDWKMPGMDGWETTRRIRQLAQRNNLPQPLVVMITAHSGEMLEQRTEAEQDMINGFIVKPVTASMLYDALMDAGTGRTAIRRIANGRNSARQLTGMRILVVEDNLINQQVADELLTAAGAIVALAANGQLGVDAVAAAAPQFDVVLMDLQMPVLDGYGATRAIRIDLGLTSLPIVAMTANAMASDYDACIAAGMNDHIGKPFDIANLLSLLIRVTGLAAPPSASDGQETLSADAPMALPKVRGLDIQTAVNRMSGMRSLYVRTARDFVKIMGTIVPELQACLASGDAKKAKMGLHTLKGNAGTLGATDLATQAARLEKLCTTSAGLKECQQHLGDFETLIRSTQGLLNEAIALLEPAPAGTSSKAEATMGQAIGEAAVAALRHIATLAKASDFEVLEAFAEARELLAALPVESFDALDLALQDLDLETAATVCENILSGLD